MTLEGVASVGFGGVTTGGFLAAFALALGANNLQIGILAALPFITQPLQIPAILLVEKFRRRKLLAVSSWILAQALWIPVALIPVFIGTPSSLAVSLLLASEAVSGSLTAVTNASLNGWVRDLVPRRVLGRFFSKRLAFATATAATLGLGAALFVDFWQATASDENAVFGYTFALLFGAIFLGLASPIFMTLMPEPLMHSPVGPRLPLRATLSAPFRDANFRHLLRFLFAWQLAVNLAVPFFAVYMLRKLGMPLTVVIVLTVISQLANVLTLRVWGRFVDRFGSKVVLSSCASLLLLVIVGWTFTTMPDRHFLTVPLLVVLHLFAGVATAGVTLALGTVGMRLAPRDQATSYLAVASLFGNLGAGIGPILGGILADFFAVRELSLSFQWMDPGGVVEFPAISLGGYDFFFVIAFLLGVLSLNGLIALREGSDVGREVVLDELLSRTRGVARAVSSVPGSRLLSRFPYSYIRHVPGLDVALGVTAYEIADSVKTAVSVTTKGEHAATDVARRLSRAVSSIAAGLTDLERHGIEIA